VTLPTFSGPGLDPAKLGGIVVDDPQAELRGKWSDGGNLPGYVGDGYLFSSDAQASARFPFAVERTGNYEVRVAWQPHENRARELPVTVRSSNGEKKFTLDQSRAARGPGGFESLGAFRFTAHEPAAVLFTVAGAKGIVHVDAVQLVPVN
jgi:hypothetical protein